MSGGENSYSLASIVSMRWIVLYFGTIVSEYQPTHFCLHLNACLVLFRVTYSKGNERVPITKPPLSGKKDEMYVTKMLGKILKSFTLKKI